MNLATYIYNGYLYIQHPRRRGCAKLRLGRLALYAAQSGEHLTPLSNYIPPTTPVPNVRPQVLAFCTNALSPRNIRSRSLSLLDPRKNVVEIPAGI